MKKSFFNLFLLFIYLFLLLAREINKQGERMRERERETETETETENLKQVPCSAQSWVWGSIPQPWDHDLNRNQESDAQLTEPPGAPEKKSFNEKFQGLSLYKYSQGFLKL